MKLVIAEKPMLARDIARAMCGKSVSENAKLPISGNGYTVCACAGHLLELVEPEDINPKWQKWNIDTLPIYCENWKKRPVKDKAQLVKNIASLLENADIVINAGDPDDEGQLIVDEVLEYLDWQGETLRVFVNDNIEKNIVKAFSNLKDNRECVSTGRAAYARQMADKCFGYTETRLATKRLGTLCRLGRVQTPTLGLVVERDKLIEEHVKQKYYELFISGIASAQGGVQAAISQGITHETTLKLVPFEEMLDDDKHVLEKGKLEHVAEELQGFRGNLSVTNEQKKEFAPLPYNLTKLQSDMSKRYKFSAKKTLDVTQALRDKYKAITYNRSDSQYLKEEHYLQAQSVLEQAMKNCGVNWWTLDYSLKSKAFNDKNVTAHHGIIPQEVNVSVDKMTADEKKVYMAIVERYAMQFMPPAVYLVAKGEIPCDSGKLIYSEKKLKEQGFKAQVGKDACENNQSEDAEQSTAGENSVLEAGDYEFVATGSNICEKETKPPARYTEGTLIADMSCIAKYCKDEEIKRILKAKDDGKKGENGGIGTTATRADIIEKLFKGEYLEEKKGKLVSTRKARALYALLPNDIKTADTTARWWLIQQDIEDDKADVNAIQRDVVRVFNEHKDSAYIGSKLAGGEVGKCPVCGKNVVLNNRGNICSCESNKSKKQGDTWVQIEGCGFKMFTSFAQKKISSAQLDKLLSGQEVLVNGLTGKKGKYNAFLKLNTAQAEDNGFYRLEISKFPPKKHKK